MPWIEEPRPHVCALPAEIRRDAKWYCSACGQVWRAVLIDPKTYDFIRDRPMSKFWAYKRVEGEFVK